MLPEQYRWLEHELGPPIIGEALKERRRLSCGRL